LAVLIDKEGASGAGHGAGAVGNDREGWTYMSKDGGKLLVSGKADYTIDEHSTLKELLYSDDGQRYEQGLLIPITHEQADNLVEDMSREVQTFYMNIGANCMDAVLDAMHENGIGTEYNYHFFDPIMTITPNGIFMNMKEYYQYTPGVGFYNDFNK
jgi:hypothetical protein